MRGRGLSPPHRQARHRARAALPSVLVATLLGPGWGKWVSGEGAPLHPTLRGTPLCLPCPPPPAQWGLSIPRPAAAFAPKAHRGMWGWLPRGHEHMEGRAGAPGCCRGAGLGPWCWAGVGRAAGGTGLWPLTPARSPGSQLCTMRHLTATQSSSRCCWRHRLPWTSRTTKASPRVLAVAHALCAPALCPLQALPAVLAHGRLMASHPCRHAAPALCGLAGQEGAHENGAEGRLLCEHPI